jgi:predicted nicotinamide N-methyase
MTGLPEGSVTLPPDLRELDSRHVIATTTVALPGGDVLIEHPRNADDLISEADYVKDERLPYWADLWPSALCLARSFHQLRRPATRMLELGCGLGLVTIAALRAGHHVLATDYYEDSLRFTRRNSLRATGCEPDTRIADWRAWPANLGRFDLVVASDILYEKSYALAVASVIAGSLSDNGVAFIADPGRLALPDFRAECAKQNLEVTERFTVPYEDGAINQVITIHEIRGRAR